VDVSYQTEGVANPTSRWTLDGSARRPLRDKESRIASDTVNGIVPADQEKVFEEFRQVGTAAKQLYASAASSDQSFRS